MVTLSVSHLSNDDLINDTKKAAASERGATAQLVALLAEFDARRLYLGQGCSSLFAYCTSVLHLSEHAAYHRIEAARAARQFPAILDRLAEGAVTLTAVGLLRPHLTAENHVALLDAARHQSKREVERLIAGLAPQAAVAPLVRRLPVIKPLSVELPERQALASRGSADVPSGPPPIAETPAVDTRPEVPSSGDRYMLRLTIGGDTHAKLQRARDLLRHTLPSGDPAAILDRALTVLVEQLERAKIAATSRPRQRAEGAGGSPERPTRHIPAAVRRAVWVRDGGRCTFVGSEGRCIETGRLEFHHISPYARGGRTDATNLTLRCRPHNAYDARLAFGDRQSWLSSAARD